MENRIIKEILIGFIISIIATAFGFFIYVEVVSTYSFEETLKIIKEGNLYGKILGLSAIPNLFVFFVFLKKKQDYRAKGVILATFFVAFLILISLFL
jgi:heme/copper-type cytochrome/quinol oxidase subunit 4